MVHFSFCASERRPEANWERGIALKLGRALISWHLICRGISDGLMNGSSGTLVFLVHSPVVSREAKKAKRDASLPLLHIDQVLLGNKVDHRETS